MYKINGKRFLLANIRSEVEDKICCIFLKFIMKINFSSGDKFWKSELQFCDFANNGRLGSE